MMVSGKIERISRVEDLSIVCALSRPTATMLWCLVWLLVSASYAYQGAHLSHHGIYTNLPYNTPLVLYIHPDELVVENSTLSLSAITRRTWPEVQQCTRVAFSLGMQSMEACEEYDVENEPVSHQILHDADLHGDLSIPIRPNPLPDLRSIGNDTALHSVTVTLHTVSSDGKPRFYRWWIAHFSQPLMQRARWPIAPGEYVSRAGEANHVRPTSWDGFDVPRLSGLMHDPFMTVSRNEQSALGHTWSRGISIRVRTNGTSVPVRCSVAGIVVWSGYLHRAMPPFDGPERGVNDQHLLTIMIRDSWGFVHQFVGLEVAQVAVDEAVAVGTVLGYLPSTPLSPRPRSTASLVDMPKHYKEEGYESFPYRFRYLEIRVARPHSAWTSYKDPNAKGWLYYNPLLLYVPGRSPPPMIAPFVDPSSFAFRPMNMASIPYAMSMQHGSQWIPHQVELFVSFQPLIESPGDPADAMDPVSVYALDWAVEPEAKQPLCSSRHTYWRRSFEHSRLASETELDDPAFLHAHYVPHLSIRFRPGMQFSSQRYSQFDEKDRALYYAVTRQILGLPDVRGAWNTTRENSYGTFRVAVRARSLTSAYSCVEARVHVPHERPSSRYLRILSAVFTPSPHTLPSFWLLWIADLVRHSLRVFRDTLR